MVSPYREIFDLILSLPCMHGNFGEKHWNMHNWYIYQNSLIIHKIKTKEINTETEYRYVRKNLHNLTQLSSQFSPKIRICFRCNMKHSKECFITYPRTSKCVKKTQLCLVFSTHFLLFGYVMKHFPSGFIYYITYSN